MTLDDNIEHCISSGPIASLDSQLLSLSSLAPDPSSNLHPPASHHDPIEGARGEIRKDSKHLTTDCVQKTADISRHDSVSASLTRQSPGRLPGTSDPASESGAGPQSALTIFSPDASSGAVVAALGKRSPSAHRPPTQPLGSPFKKPRLVAPGDISLPPPPQTPHEFEASRDIITSPLFFSHNAKLTMPRPHSFATSEAAAAIMGEPESSDGVINLRLPKAVTTASPARSSGTPGSWSSTELSSLSRSPDGWHQSSTIQLLQGIGVVELLEQDDRPTLILDLHDASNFSSGSLSILFANAALRTAPGVLEALQADTAADTDSNTEFSQFKSWARERGPSGVHTGASSMVYAGLTWTTSTLRRRFRLLRGTSSPNDITPTSPPAVIPSQAQPPLLQDERWNGRWTGRDPPLRERGDYFGAIEHGHARAHSEPRSRSGSIADTVIPPLDDMLIMPTLTPQLHTTFDWTRIPSDDANLGEHHRLARSVDWASTSLGPIELWPADLRIMSNMIMGSPHPAALYWGPEYVAIYNEAYIALAGKKHPNLMGARYKDAWSEIWDEFEPIFEAAWKDGNATMKHDDGIFITRHGFLEETFFNWAIIPLVGGDGSVVALYNPAFENTRRKISERRMLTLREVGVKTSQARDVKAFWSQLQQGLSYNEYDVPFALIYSVSEEESEGSSMASGNAANPPQIVLEGSIGVPEGHPCATPFIDLRFSEQAFAGYMRDSMSNPSAPTVLSEEDGTLPAELIAGLEWRGFGDPCKTIVIFPVHPTTAGDTVVGFIVLGVNPRRQYDEDYKLFVNLLSRQLATSMASVVLFEEEIKRGQRAARLAALDRQELSMQLHLRTQEAVKSEYRFTRMAEFGPVGLFIADGQGHINYCNDMWYKISGHDRGARTLDAWMRCVRDEDQAGVESVWRRLVEEKTAVTHEFRFKGSKRLLDGHHVDIWALMSAYPEKEDTGELKSIFGCITDISQQKWAEDFQKQRTDEAVELKRQQENFIDITSHEMRNPLSAILQCADEISSSLHRYRQDDLAAQSKDKLSSLINSCVEAAQTISLCASHQKRIVDDILTLSKLDSKLLLVTPVDVQPIMVVQNVLKMFETELNTHEISGEFRIEQSYKDLAIDWVKLDPSRLRQVLINLMTNAIKFTQGRPTRSILISMGASKELEEVEGLSYIPPRHPDQEDLTDSEDWADGEKINLHLAVSDTGPGLDDDEKKILFQRFSQASPRTHVQYGGSGLGLFICRILTELQGGQIGVQSEKGHGSTFAFYIKSRRSDHPQVDLSASVPTPHPTPPRPTPSNLPPEMKEEEAIAPKMLDGPILAPPPPVPNRENASSRGNNTSSKSLDIMIVEDNIVNQKVLQRQLTLSGNNTLVANHGGEALQELRKSKFWDNDALESEPMWLSNPPSDSSGPSDQEEVSGNKNISVILMDLEMPVMDGMSCTREIRRLEKEGVLTRHIPIIAVTAYARPEQIDNAKAAGVDDVISKPFRIPELLPKIEELVAKYGMMSCS
ncbi:histidine protein kinase [Podospora fimiseda]|uniref:Histidine protein kinase n=1 Tax=Podospora fimiseda TaxID=252190 RepID=A0AAN7BX42_9PEZI|nr:histidine protein kinase [Podospora fimiseda]